jgi:hypothetical protein
MSGTPQRRTQSVAHRDSQNKTKSNPVEKHPLGLFYCLNGADLKAKEKAGAMITPAER